MQEWYFHGKIRPDGTHEYWVHGKRKRPVQ
jgi:hypothetical protein